MMFMSDTKTNASTLMVVEWWSALGLCYFSNVFAQLVNCFIQSSCLFDKKTIVWSVGNWLEALGYDDRHTKFCKKHVVVEFHIEVQVPYICKPNKIGNVE